MSMLRCRVPGMWRSYGMHRHAREVLEDMDHVVTETLQAGKQGFRSLFGRHTVKELEEGYQVRVELPGVSKDNIKVQRMQDLLKIFAEDKSQSVTSRYEQIFRLPENAHAQTIKAEAKDGILTVDVPKTKKAIEASKVIDVPLS